MPKTEPTQIARRPRSEDRMRPKVETRSDDAKMIVGYAAVFYDASDPDGTQYELWEDTYERIHPGAFDAAIQEDDVRGLANHNDTWLLGRGKSGTLRLSVDKVGLRYEIDVPDTQAGRDTLASIERGDLDGSSFGFRVLGGKRGRVEWTVEIVDGRTLEIRNVYDLELYDVGPVTFPAYSGTTATTRDEYLAEARADHKRQAATRADKSQSDEYKECMIDMHVAIAEAEMETDS